MQNQSTTIYSNAVNKRNSRVMFILVAAIAIGVILIIVFNSNQVPFGRSLNKHPPQLIGLVLIVIAIFGLVILCVRCLVISPNQTPLASTTTYTFSTFSQPGNLTNVAPPAWQVVYPAPPVPATVSGTANQPSTVNTGSHSYNYSSAGVPVGDIYTQQQLATPQTPPPEFELPPSYAEAIKTSPVIK